MTPDLRRNLVISGSIGAAVACGALCVLMFLPRTWDHLAVISNLASLPADQVRLYSNQVASDLTFDSVYLLGHAVMWIGFAALVSNESKGVANSIAILGLLGSFLDFTENEMRWAAVKLAVIGSAAPANRLADWQMVFGLSYWPLFLCCILTSIAVARRPRGGFVLVALAAACTFAGPSVYKAGPLPAFLWIIAWHFGSALFLWGQIPSKEALSRP